MAEQLTVTVHEIATDGLPDMNALVGRVAFIFDGNIVSGWPLVPREMRREGLDIGPSILEHAAQGDVLWEGDSDVANHLKFSGVTHWIEFPVPVWDIAKSGPHQVNTERPDSPIVAAPEGFLQH